MGTGSSAVQSTPLIAEQAAQVHVFQRTPNYSLPALNAPLTDEEVAGFRANFPAYVELLRSGQPPLPIPPADYVPSDEELNALVAQLWNGWGLISAVQIPNIARDERLQPGGRRLRAGQDRRDRQGPGPGREADPARLPVHDQAGLRRHRLVRDLQPRQRRRWSTCARRRSRRSRPTGVRTTEREYPRRRDRQRPGLRRHDRAPCCAWTFVAATAAPGATPGPRVPRPIWAWRWRGFPNLFTVTGPGQPVGADQRADRLRAARRLDHGRHRPRAGDQRRDAGGHGRGPGRPGRPTSTTRPTRPSSRARPPGTWAPTSRANLGIAAHACRRRL